MKKRTKEEMAVYQRDRRKRVTPPVTPAENVTPVHVTPVKSNTLDVTPVTPCPACADMELKNGILRGRVLMLETELREAKKKIPLKSDSPYRGF